MTFCKKIGLFASVVLLFGWFGKAVGADDIQPNILLILTDDQKLDTVGCYGLNPLASSPNLDRLAAEGVRFTQAYCSAPQCVTSRRSIATGQYPHHNGVYGFEDTHAYTDSFHPFWWAPLKKQQGYYTTLVGKEHLHYKWYWSALPGQQLSSYLRQYGFTPKDLLHDKLIHYWRERPDIENPFYVHETVNGKRKVKNNWFVLYDDDQYELVRSYRRLRKEINNLIFAGYNPRAPGDTIDDYILKDYQEMLNGLSGVDKPVSIELAFKFPHTPVLPPKEIAEKFEKFNFEIPEFSAREKAEILAVPQMKELYCSLRSDGMTDAEIKKLIAHNFALCAYGDGLIGRAIDDFKAFSKKKGRPWLIIFTADHGVHLHEHGMIEKFTMYDESVHVPFIIASSDKKRFPAGIVYDEFVELVDIAPTILAFAGENLSDQRYSYLDGFDLVGLIQGRIPEREEVLVQSSHICGHRALLRTKEWAFSMRTRPVDADFEFEKNYGWARNASDNETEMTLFDIKNDPAETRNLAGLPEYKTVRDRLRRRLEDRVLGPDRVEYPWHEDLGRKPPFFEPSAQFFIGD